MYKLCLFAGTTEGRALTEFLAGQEGVTVTVCVATEYGETLLPESDNVTVSARPLPVGEITALLERERFHLVIDATHPYAASITGSIAAACAATGTAYRRLLRGDSQRAEEAIYVADSREACDFLAGKEGNVLLTTGSKDLPVFAALPDFDKRVYARVLPVEASLRACTSAGLPVSHILAMQGPFSREMNTATLRTCGASWLVTKDGGDIGGFEDKVAAAREVGAGLVVIGRPPQREGLDYGETVALLCRDFGCCRVPHVAVVGIGPGSRDAMTAEVRRAIGEADCLIGAGRMLELAAVGQGKFEAVSPDAIADFIENHAEYDRFAVVMSGDVGFFSGAKKLLPRLTNCKVEVLSGLSSLAYLCGKIATSYEDVAVVSLHGRQGDIVRPVREHRRLFVLTGGENTVAALCCQLTAAGLGEVRLWVGENLSYPTETVTHGTAAELSERTFATLSVALIENDEADGAVQFGLPDTAFQRGGDGAVVPMTKSEVRAVCLSKLRLTERAVCWDIGAGTGSVSVEMARLARKGTVYAVERRGAALELLAENGRRFGVENIRIIEGTAPDCCGELPAPSHVFIGGSGGNMAALLALALEKNPAVRIVATAVSLETVAELTAAMKEFPFTETEVVSLQVAQGRTAGAYHLMTAQNPVYIFTMQGGGTAV